MLRTLSLLSTEIFSFLLLAAKASFAAFSKNETRTLSVRVLAL
jgi:hypothetical protein